jgi:hypothetical protein
MEISNFEDWVWDEPTGTWRNAKLTRQFIEWAYNAPLPAGLTIPLNMKPIKLRGGLKQLAKYDPDNVFQVALAGQLKTAIAHGVKMTNPHLRAVPSRDYGQTTEVVWYDDAEDERELRPDLTEFDSLGEGS